MTDASNVSDSGCIRWNDTEVELASGDPIEGTDAESGIPDSDPWHEVPQDGIAALFEGDTVDITITDERSEQELQQFLTQAEAGELESTPSTEALVRIARVALSESR